MFVRRERDFVHIHHRWIIKAPLQKIVGDEASSARRHLAEFNHGLLAVGEREGGLVVAEFHFAVHDGQRGGVGVIDGKDEFRALDASHRAARDDANATRLNMTRWRITDKRRQRQPHIVAYHESPAEHEPDDEDYEKLRKLAKSPEVAPDLEKLWDLEWEKNLLAAATANARRRVDPLQYQIFDCQVNKGWPVERVAQAFGMTPNHVYVTKYRVAELIKEEAERLQKEVI